MVFKSQSKTDSDSDGLTSIGCFSRVASILSKEFSFQKDPEKNIMFISHLAYLSNCTQSVHSSSKQLRNILSESTVRYHLAKYDIETLCNIGEVLVHRSCCNILKPGKAYTLAIDETDDPYYGNDKKTNEYVVGGKTKKSTNTFYRYIAVAIVKGNEKFTLGILPVPKKTKKVDFIRRLVDMVFSYDIRIEMLMLDRGFYSGDIVDYLQQNHIPFIIPMKVHSRKNRDILESLKKSDKWTISMKTSDKRMIAVDAGAVVKFATDANTKRYKNSPDGKIRLPYIFGDCSWAILKIHEEYEHRFMIETTFRMRNQVKPFTCTRNPAIRYLFVLISIVLLNAWKAFQIRYFTKKGPGRKRIEEDPFRLQVFLLLITVCLFYLLRVIDSVIPLNI